MKRKDTLQILSVTDEPLLVYQISNEYELQDMMEDIQREFRSARAYKGYVYWTKSFHKQSICSEMNINTFNYDNVNLELHHYPISLYDYAYSIGLKLISELAEDEVLTTFNIVDILIREHFKNNIGVVPLLKSWHQMYHAGLYDIKPEQIHGNYKQFLNDYKPFLSEKLEKMRIE